MSISVESFPASLRPLLRRCHVDFAPSLPPTTLSVLGASIVAIVGSLAADILLVALATHLMPQYRDYAHFQFSDYAKLTVIGVIIACIGWPIVARISSAPRWLFSRLAVLVTLVLFVPDAYIWWQGQPGKAVGVLLALHVAIAVVTYLSLVHLAPPARHGRR